MSVGVDAERLRAVEGEAHEATARRAGRDAAHDDLVVARDHVLRRPRQVRDQLPESGDLLDQRVLGLALVAVDRLEVVGEQLLEHGGARGLAVDGERLGIERQHDRFGFLLRHGSTIGPIRPAH
jgi:hypothetical protein